MGLAVMILMAAVPWAYQMHGRVTAIETAIVTIAEGATAASILSDRVNSLENRITAIQATGILPTARKEIDELKNIIAQLREQIRTQK